MVHSSGLITNADELAGVDVMTVVFGQLVTLYLTSMN